MKKLIYLSISLVLTYGSRAQSLAINTDASIANSSAMLDIKNPNKGVLLPRVALTGTNDVVTILSPATSLLVYNTATVSGSNAVTPGFYYYNGTLWVQLVTTSSITNLAYGITGNAGTVDGINFLGTTDNVPLSIRVNNQKSGRLDGTLLNAFWGTLSGSGITSGTNNTATGANALRATVTGYNNTADGYNSLLSNTTGFSNVALGSDALNRNSTTSNLVAVGDSALYNNTGALNTAVGSKALYSNITGIENTAMGYQALFLNTNNSNAAFGNQALRTNSSGQQNSAFGNKSLLSNTTGSQNTANGSFALFGNTSGFSNTALGVSALISNSIGNSNTAFGFQALQNNGTGSSNTAIGASADVLLGTLSNATAIGNGAVVSASNKIRLGNSAVTVVEGQVSYSFPSDARFKYNIRNNVPGLDFIKKLRPVTYYFDEEKLDAFSRTGKLNNSMVRTASYDPQKKLHTGFLAQEVEHTSKELGYSFDGVNAPSGERDHYSVAYSQFVMPLVKGMQEQQQMIEELKQKVSSQEAQFKKLSDELIKIRKLLKSSVDH